MVEMRARLESAQHILHHILTHDYKAEQTGMEIYDNKIRLDIRCKDDLSKIPKEEFEERVNSIIKKNLKLTKTIYKRDKVPKGIDISNVPKSANEIRVVAIGDFDIQPCGNSHVDNTSEIGEYKIIEIKRKGKDTYRFSGEVVNKMQPKKGTNETEEKELQIAKGVRDFMPEEKILRDRIMNTIKETLEIYGYNPIELPILERYETLAAKYAAGDDSDALKEIFVTEDNGKRKLGLRFDLTVPFSRFMGMNPELKMPFKKYITGQVFRDGPIKKGRYREFSQFDPDIVGCTDVIADAETISATESVFKNLGFDITIEFNDRKILFGILEDLKIPEKKQFDVIISIDKLKKISEKEVEKELLDKGLDKKRTAKLFEYLKTGKSSTETLNNLKKLIKSDIGKEGVKEIEDIIRYLKAYGVDSAVFLPSMARGLAYYTGPIYEVYLKGSSITSSAAGGGRYDELIGKLQGTDVIMPATGISYGIEVIVEAIKEKQKLDKKTVCQVYVIPIKTREKTIPIVQNLRKAGIKTDFDFTGRGISKNLGYANTLGIPFVIFIGEKELSQKKIKLRNMKTGKEEMVSVEEAIKKIKS